MTKEAILQKRRHVFGDRLLRALADTIYAMMDEHSKQQSILFYKWVRDNTVADGAPKVLYTQTGKRLTIDELFALFIENQTENKDNG